MGNIAGKIARALRQPFENIVEALASTGFKVFIFEFNLAGIFLVVAGSFITYKLFRVSTPRMKQIISGEKPLCKDDAIFLRDVILGILASFLIPIAVIALIILFVIIFA